MAKKATKFKPMLSGQAPDFNEIRYPVLASPKLDGIRCIMHNGVALSRTLHVLPNLHVQACLRDLPDGLDGELIVGNPCDPNVFNITQSGITSIEGTPNFKFYVFDMYFPEIKFVNRLANANHHAKSHSYCEIVPHYQINSSHDLEQCEKYYVDLGYEGIMTRDPNAMYKFGRSTTKEQYLLKIKRFKDTEGVIIGYNELEINNNEQVLDLLGNAKRSSAKAGKQAGGMLGNFVCKWAHSTATFEVGSGFNDAERIDYWKRREELIGRTIKFKYQNMTEALKPRIPIFLGFRMD